MRIGTRFARLIREGPRRVNATHLAQVTKRHKAVRPVRLGPGLVYIARMPGAVSTPDRPRSPIRRLAPLIAVALLAIAAYIIFGRGSISLEALIVVKGFCRSWASMAMSRSLAASAASR